MIASFIVWNIWKLLFHLLYQSFNIFRQYMRTSANIMNIKSTGKNSKIIKIWQEIWEFMRAPRNFLICVNILLIAWSCWYCASRVLCIHEHHEYLQQFWRRTCNTCNVRLKWENFNYSLAKVCIVTFQLNAPWILNESVVSILVS